MPLSFLRSGALDPGRRRYPIVMDSMHMKYNAIMTSSPLRRQLPQHKIYYCNSFCFTNNGRPSLERFELQLQMSFMVTAEADSHLLHIINCCVVIQLVCQLASLSARTPPTGPTLFRQDHPLLTHQRDFPQYFHGPTIYHWNFQKLYDLLTRTIKPLPERYYTIAGIPI